MKEKWRIIFDVSLPFVEYRDMIMSFIDRSTDMYKFLGEKTISNTQ